jgi:hypothetical protein
VWSLGSFEVGDIFCRAHVPIPPSELNSEVRTLQDEARSMSIVAFRKSPCRD